MNLRLPGLRRDLQARSNSMTSESPGEAMVGPDFSLNLAGKDRAGGPQAVAVGQAPREDISESEAVAVARGRQ